VDTFFIVDSVTMAQPELQPDYVYLLKQYKTVQCPAYGRSRSHKGICVKRNPDNGNRLVRDMKEVRKFLRDNGYGPGLKYQPEGTQVDHIVPLCLGGPDCVCNMQLLSASEHSLKTRRDRIACSFFKVKL